MTNYVNKIGYFFLPTEVVHVKYGAVSCIFLIHFLFYLCE